MRSTTSISTNTFGVRVRLRTARPPGTFAPGAHQVVADLGDEAALRSALTGVRAVLFVLPHDPHEEQLARNLVRAAAELCARALLDPTYPTGEYTVAGPESLSGRECARIWSQALHRPVAYVGDDEAVWRAAFRDRPCGEKLADFVATFDVLGRRRFNVSDAVIRETARLLGRVGDRDA